MAPKKDTANRPSQADQEFVKTADGRTVRNLAYAPGKRTFATQDIAAPSASGAEAYPVPNPDYVAVDNIPDEIYDAIEDYDELNTGEVETFTSLLAERGFAVVDKDGNAPGEQSLDAALETLSELDVTGDSAVAALYDNGIFLKPTSGETEPSAPTLEAPSFFPETTAEGKAEWLGEFIAGRREYWRAEDSLYDNEEDAIFDSEDGEPWEADADDLFELAPLDNQTVYDEKSESKIGKIYFERNNDATVYVELGGTFNTDVVAERGGEEVYRQTFYDSIGFFRSA